jgi:poly-gamma-glutamate synthesis protein (capsule biosynthesis protein)
MPHPCPPDLHESVVRDARDYVEAAESKHGAIPRAVEPAYIWGDALAELDRQAPDARIINLETAVTTSDDFMRGKGIHYRMNPANIACITAAKIDCCCLANNHVLDWGQAGLKETLATLKAAKLAIAGAGEALAQAQSPAVLERSTTGRVLVFAFGCESSGIPFSWAAKADRPGVYLLPDLSRQTTDTIAELVRQAKRANDIVVASIHWGGNWGYDISDERQRFAHDLIDGTGVDVIHGHSSHHVQAIEVYRGHLILYGCGDLLTDYEAITGHETYRPDLGLLYFPRIDPANGKLVGLEMTPTQIHRMRLRTPSVNDCKLLHKTLDRECRKFAAQVHSETGGRTLRLEWSHGKTESTTGRRK